MKRIHLTLVSLLVFLMDILYILHLPRFSYSINGLNILKAIPVTHWVLLILSSSLLVASSHLNHKNKFFLVFTGLMYSFLFHVTNLYFIIPYKQVEITFPSSILEFLLLSGKITREALSSHALSYLSYPVAFILETSMMLIGGIDKIAVYTVGLFVFLGTFYVGLILYYYMKDKDMKFVTLSLATYVVLSFYVINAQVAPQTLALAFLPYIYRLTFDYIEGRQPLKVLALILLFWFALVFTHPFMFMFYVLPALVTIVYNKFILKQPAGIEGSTIGIMVSTWGFGFVYLFYNHLLHPLSQFITLFGKAKGETWWVFEWFFRRSGAFGPVKYTPHPHYELVPKWITEIQAWILRMMLILFVGILLYSFIRHLKRAIISGKLSHQLVFDVFVMVSSGALFIIGLITIFLGQRSFQVAFIPLSRYISNFKAKKAIRYILMVILIMAPVAYTFNSLTNLTVGPQLFVHDEELIVAGYFGNTNLPSHSYVVVARELYPSEYPTNIRKFSFPSSLLRFKQKKQIDYVYYSIKFKHAAMYYGVFDYYKDRISTDTIYSNLVVRILHWG